MRGALRLVLANRPSLEQVRMSADPSTSFAIRLTTD